MHRFEKNLKGYSKKAKQTDATGGLKEAYGLEDIWDIDDWVEEETIQKVYTFSPKDVATALGLPLHVTAERLFQLVNRGKVTSHFEVRCPICFSATPVDLEILAADPTCACGEHVYEVTPELIYVFFKIRPEYINWVQKQNENYRGIRRFTNR
ncbi:hypothetical protein ABNE32_19980 [Paenibacillus larvae]